MVEYKVLINESVVMEMKVLFIGDIVGSIGRDAVEKYLPRLKKNTI